MESVLDTVTDAVLDAGDLVLDATLGSADDKVAGGKGLRRGLLLLMLLGAVIGIALWRRAQAAKVEDGPAPDRS
jgi:hypothetical protein